MGRKGKKETTVNNKKKGEREGEKRENHHCIADYYCKENERVQERINLYVKPKKREEKCLQLTTSRY